MMLEQRVAPTVRITRPANGATVPSVQVIDAYAADNVAVSAMSIMVDGVVVAIGNKGFLSYTWITTKGTKGLHTITATAKDTSGNTAVPVTIHVQD